MTVQPRCLVWAIGLWFLLLLVLSGSGHLHSPDDELNFRTTESLATGQGFAITPLADGFGSRAGLDGKEYSQYGLLQPVLAVPFYWAGQCLAELIPPEWLTAQANRLTTTVRFYRGAHEEKGFAGLYPENHQQRITRLAVSFFNVAVTFFTVIVLWVWLAKLFGSCWGTPLLIALVYLVGTMAWPHARPFYSEALATLMLLVCFVSSDRLGWPLKLSGTFGWGTLAGITAALAFLTRLDSGVALPGLFFLACARLVSPAQPFTTVLSENNSVPACKRSAWLRMAVIATGALSFGLVMAILPIWNYWHYGNLLASGYSDQPEGIQFNIPLLQSLWIYFLSPGKGLFWYSPVLLLALLGWSALWRKDRILAMGNLVLIGGYVFIIGRWQNLGGWCWGPRHLFQINLFLLLPLGWWWQARNSTDDSTTLADGQSLATKSNLWGWLLGFFLACSVLVQLSGVLVDFMWPLDRGLTGLPPGMDTQRVLSASFYGPYLHWKSYQFDPRLDLWWVDFWKSGATMARCLVASLWGVFLILSTAWWMVLKRHHLLKPGRFTHNSDR